MAIQLDRTALDDVGANPVRLAEAIHEQLGDRPAAVPIEAIAIALDIAEIRRESLTNIEAALITTRERDCGSILVNANSSRQRQRFSVGHELGHFLNPWHTQTATNGFYCSRSDMIARTDTATNQYLRQEAEANAFAINLLAPRKRLRPYLSAGADLQNALKVAAELDLSREAAARRYVELHEDTLAVVFAKDDRLIYAARCDGFPALRVKKGDAIATAGDRGEGQPSRFEETEAADWLSHPGRHHLLAQTLHQQAGYSITLLRAASLDDEDDPGIDDIYERLTRPISERFKR
jgi:Zn-dependent peptidase ImmA (M78 family)